MPPHPASAAETALGTLGGVFLSICLLPQLWKMWKTGSAADLAYGWLALYGAGLALNTAYLVLAAAPVGAAFHGAELGLVILMTGWKWLLDRRGKPIGELPGPPGHPPVPPARV